DRAPHAARTLPAHPRTWRFALGRSRPVARSGHAQRRVLSTPHQPLRPDRRRRDSHARDTPYSTTNRSRVRCSSATQRGRRHEVPSSAHVRLDKQQYVVYTTYYIGATPLTETTMATTTQFARTTPAALPFSAIRPTVAKDDVLVLCRSCQAQQRMRWA